MLYPEKQPGKKGTSSETEKVSSTRLSYARAVYWYAPDLTGNVLSGATSLDEAQRKFRFGTTQCFQGPPIIRFFFGTDLWPRLCQPRRRRTRLVGAR